MTSDVVCDFIPGPRPIVADLWQDFEFPRPMFIPPSAPAAQASEKPERTCFRCSDRRGQLRILSVCPVGEYSCPECGNEWQKKVVP